MMYYVDVRKLQGLQARTRKEKKMNIHEIVEEIHTAQRELDRQKHIANTTREECMSLHWTSPRIDECHAKNHQAIEKIHKLTWEIKHLEEKRNSMMFEWYYNLQKEACVLA